MSSVAGGVGNLLGNLGASPEKPPAEKLTQAEELEELRKQYKAADRRVHELRATGGPALQEAYDALKVLKPKYRALRDEVERKGTPRAAASGAVGAVHGSSASQTSARRLERQRAREAMRKGGGAGAGERKAGGGPGDRHW